MIKRPEPHPPIVVERWIPHAPDDVFGLWRDAQSVQGWMCPAPTVSIVEIDWPFQVGHAYRITMDVEGTPVTFRGEFIEIVERERLVFTWISSRTDEVPTRVSVEFVADHDATLVRLTHDLLPSAESAEDHRVGWERILGELEGKLAR